jgi:quercetin dioxygenase-like cupin family protein
MGNGSLNVLGNEVAVHVSGDQSGGSVEVIVHTTPPGLGVPPHVHTREDEIFHVLEGEMEFTLNGRIVVRQVGTTLFAPRNVPHAFTARGTSPLRILLVVTPAHLQPMFVELSQLPPGPPDMRRVGEICGRYGIAFV